MTSLDEFGQLSELANFVTLIATYLEGFAVIFEPNGTIIAGVSEPLLQCCCLDSSIAIAPLFKKFKTGTHSLTYSLTHLTTYSLNHLVIITSGTLSPIDLYPKLLSFSPGTHCYSPTYSLT
jgi:DNA excision repair protein ERCC-2